MAAQRGLGLFAAVPRGAQSSRATAEAGQPRWWLGMCSGSTAEQPDRLARGTRAGTTRPAARPATRFLGCKLRTKSCNPENACGFVEITPGLYHHAKGSCWAHSRGRWERFANTYRTEVVEIVTIPIDILSSSSTPFLPSLHYSARALAPLLLHSSTLYVSRETQTSAQSSTLRSRPLDYTASYDGWVIPANTYHTAG